MLLREEGEECVDKDILQHEKVCCCKPLSLGLTWQLVRDQCHLQHQQKERKKKKREKKMRYEDDIALCNVICWICERLTSFGQIQQDIKRVRHCVLPVAQRAMKVWTCLRISASLSSGSGSLLTMCSMKSFGVTAARFHFNFPNTTSSHSLRERDRERRTERVANRER